MTLAQWFSFNGRISRKTWWIFYFLIPILLSLLLGILSLFVAFIFFIQPNLARLMELIGNTIAKDQFAIADIFFDRTVIWISIVFYGPTLPLAWLWLCGSIKRFHDLNVNWHLPVFITIMQYLFYVISFFLFVSVTISFFADPVSSPSLNPFWSFVFEALEILLVVAFLIEILVLGFLRGTPGPNRFGPDPLAPPAANIALPPQPQ